VIRFSAGLVVVAIGVLIGGAATSKLSLVYGAIAVSALALVVLAIGVALNRDEIFGDGPELAPADAGAGSGTSAGQSADAGHVRGNDGHVREDLEQIRPSVPGPATAAFAAAAAASPTVASPTVAAPSVTTPPVGPPTGGPPTGGPAADSSPLGNPPLAHRRSAFGQAPTREADSSADWQTRPPQPPWPSDDQVGRTWTPTEQAPKAPQSGTAPVLPPRAWASPEQSSAPTSRAGSGPVAPSWFDRLNQSVDDPAPGPGTDLANADPAKTESAKIERKQAESAKAEQKKKAESAKAGDTESIATSANAAAVSAAEPTSTPGSDRPQSGHSGIGGADDPSAVTQTAADAPAADDDDWPTRYSWLEDDETDGAVGVGQPDVVAEAADAADSDQVDDVAETASAKARAAEPAATEAGSPAPAQSAGSDAEDHATTADDAGAAAEPDADPAEAPAVDAAHEDEDEDEPSAPSQSDLKLVTVIPGVPRYHDPDCILIRFMGEGDIARKSIPEARAANCTPCAACQPEG
jgi:hypothetical protein